MTGTLTKDQVKEILSKNGINDLDQLASLVASNALDDPLSDSINAVGSSWVIKVFRLSAVDRFSQLPDELGGSFLRGDKTLK